MTTVAAASVSLPLSAHANCTTVINTCTQQSAIIKKCPAYASTPAVQAAVTDMDGAVGVLSGTDTQLTQARAVVTTLEGQRDTQMLTVHLKHANVETALNTASNGDPAAAKAWLGQTKTRAVPLPVGSSNLPPEKPAVRNVKKHPGMILASCAEEQSTVGYAFQMGTDPAHPESWPPQVVTSGHTYKVGNLPIGQVVYLRIAVIRRGSIQSPWSPILQIQVR